MNSRIKNRRHVFVEAVINTEWRKKAIRKLRNTNVNMPTKQAKWKKNKSISLNLFEWKTFERKLKVGRCIIR